MTLVPPLAPVPPRGGKRDEPSLSISEHAFPRSVRARWVFPVEGPPLENGIVEISAGRIAAVHARLAPVDLDLGNAAILPGLVNAHTHLELSDVASPLGPPAPFTAWLRSVIAHRRQRDDIPSAADNAVARGTEESLRTGTTLVGDIVSAPWPERAGRPAPHGVAFLELLGLSKDRIAPQLERARAHLQETRTASLPAPSNPQSPLPALSPHAPYSVHPELFTELVRLARDFKAPLAMHLAETPGELELLDRGAGEFVEFLKRLGVWQPTAIPRGSRPLDYLRELADLPCALVIHGNYLNAEERAFLRDCRGVSVVYCPRTHHYFRHDRHPFAELLNQGVNVAIGTDSRASNPDLSVWNELQFLKDHRAVAPQTLLELGTIRGARALGLQRETGTLCAGKSADLAVVSLRHRDTTDPWSLLFDSSSRATGTMCCGTWGCGPLNRT